jgi:DNA (cytosine-5)-methyltransferase 1
MGLPDNYKLPTGRTASYNLTGDGLVVPVVRYLAQHMLAPILEAADMGMAAE